MIPWPSSRNNASWVNFKTSCPNSIQGDTDPHWILQVSRSTVLSMIHKRPFGSKPILFSLRRDQTLLDKSPPSSWCYPREGALRDKPTLAQPRTPDQCGPMGPPLVPQDPSNMTGPVPFPRDR
jgi:hypothetical protein